MSARENECQISQNYILHMKFSEFDLCFHNSCEIWHSFSRPTVRNFLWCYCRWLITSLAFEKCKKECNILSIILVQGFCPLKVKITQFPGGFRLNRSLNYGFVSVYTYLYSERDQTYAFSCSTVLTSSRSWCQWNMPHVPQWGCTPSSSEASISKPVLVEYWNTP